MDLCKEKPRASCSRHIQWTSSTCDCLNKREEIILSRKQMLLQKMPFSDTSWSRPGPRGSHHHQHLLRARLVEIVRAWMNWSSWGTLPDTYKVLGQPELVGTKGCFRQEHISMDISRLGLGFLPSRDSVVTLLRDDGAL